MSDCAPQTCFAKAGARLCHPDRVSGEPVGPSTGAGLSLPMRRALRRLGRCSMVCERLKAVGRSLRAIWQAPLARSSWTRPRPGRVVLCRAVSVEGNALRLHFADQATAGRMVLVMPEIRRRGFDFYLTGAVERRVIVLRNAVGIYPLGCGNDLGRRLDAEITLKFAPRMDREASALRLQPL